ncbi:MAG: Ig-like domain-containing protein, partial [Ginsengibacter sp.]
MYISDPMRNYTLLLFIFIGIGCSKKTEQTPAPPPPVPGSFSVVKLSVNELTVSKGINFFNVKVNPVIKIAFAAPVDHASVTNNVTLSSAGGIFTSFNISYANNDSVLLLQPAAALQPLSKYIFNIKTGLQSTQQVGLPSNQSFNFITAIDSTDKFPRVSDDALLDLIQKQTFKYFWDFGHPVSGMALERNTSGDMVTTGGTGFGVMSILVGINRNFISRTEGLQRINTIVSFLKDKCSRYHGAFSH